MNSIGWKSRFFMVAVSIPVLFISLGCGSKQIQELQATTQQTTQAIDTLERQQETRYQEIQLTQNNLQQVLQQLSDRLSDVESGVQTIQQRMGRMEEFSSSSATLTQELGQDKQELQGDVQTLANQIQTLASELNNVSRASQQRYTDSVQRTRDAQVELDQRITAMETNNRAMFERILNEMGAAAPGGVGTTQPTVGDTRTYTVASGDTLSNIAERFGVTTRAIQDLNGISNPSLIQVGQQLQIPN